MSWSVRDLRDQAARVRAYWRSPPLGKHLSAEGATLLSMVENAAMDDDTEKLKADNARLRKLIAHAEWAAGDDNGVLRIHCPWCDAENSTIKQDHYPECPAFSGPGIVR